MIQLPDLPLSPATQQQLETWQNSVNTIGKYPARVAAAKSLFSKYNKPKNPAFAEVRRVLAEMCSGAQRCGYCEDSAANQVEHIKPKDIYPEVVFAWENYLFACGPCNSPKSNLFAVFSQKTGQFVSVTRSPGASVVPPEPGDPVLINPRAENPLDFLQLDLGGTFYFLPRFGLAVRDRKRAEYTLEVLRLNDRDYLVAARAEAFDSYQSRLFEYVSKKVAGHSPKQLSPLVKSLQRMQHPTVWKEMQRQHILFPRLKELFVTAPEALSW